MAATPKHSFTKEQVAEYQENFKEFDADGSGTIEPKELKAVLERCGVESTDAQVSELIRDAAKSGKEELDFDDFLGLMWKMQSGPSEKDIRTAMFEVFDDNLDGLVTVEKLRNAFKKAFADTKGAVDIPTDDMLKRMIAEASADGTALTPDDLNSLLDSLASS